MTCRRIIGLDLHRPNLPVLSPLSRPETGLLSCAGLIFLPGFTVFPGSSSFPACCPFRLVSFPASLSFSRSSLNFLVSVLSRLSSSPLAVLSRLVFLPTGLSCPGSSSSLVPLSCPVNTFQVHSVTVSRLISSVPLSFPWFIIFQALLLLPDSLSFQCHVSGSALFSCPICAVTIRGYRTLRIQSQFLSPQRQGWAL